AVAYTRNEPIRGESIVIVLFGRSWQGSVATRIRLTGGYSSQFHAGTLATSAGLFRAVLALALSPPEQPASNKQPATIAAGNMNGSSFIGFTLSVRHFSDHARRSHPRTKTTH